MTKQHINNQLKAGGVGIIPTDTVYGLVGSALKPKTVARIYRLKRRSPQKPFIILIASLADLKKFGLRLTAKEKSWLHKLWPGPVSVILPIADQGLVKKLAYLHRGGETLAFRLPNKKWLKTLLRQTGPLIAPSANPEGRRPARTISQAKKYFGQEVDFYLAAGRRLKSWPSTLISLVRGKIKLLRRARATKLDNRE